MAGLCSAVVDRWLLFRGSLIILMFLKTTSWLIRKILISISIRIKLAKWITPKRQTGKLFLLSKIIDVSSISCTIVYTNMASLGELTLGVLICLDMDWIETLHSQEIIDSFKTQVLIVTKLKNCGTPKSLFSNVRLF